MSDEHDPTESDDIGNEPAGHDVSATESPYEPADLEERARAIEAAYERMGANADVLGTLILHYPSRFVTLQCDGNTAMRVLSVIAGTAGREATDPLHLFSPATSGWLVITHESVLAAAWTPGPDLLPERVTFDPPGAR